METHVMLQKGSSKNRCAFLFAEKHRKARSPGVFTVSQSDLGDLWDLTGRQASSESGRLGSQAMFRLSGQVPAPECGESRSTSFEWSKVGGFTSPLFARFKLSTKPSATKQLLLMVRRTFPSCIAQSQKSCLGVRRLHPQQGREHMLAARKGEHA